jgi:uncharacterized membrane protein
MDGGLQALTLASALGCGLVAGFLFAFSGAVMDALGRLRPPEGVRAMQSINVMVVRPPVMLAMFGTAAACIALVVALSNWDEPFGPWLLAGSLLYLAGPIVYNVPRNNALSAAEPGRSRRRPRRLWRFTSTDTSAPRTGFG